MQLDIQAIGKALNQIISVLGIGCLKDKNKFYSAIADFLPGCSFEVERNILCACICSEVSGSLIEAASKSQNEKQLAFNNCIQYLIKQQKLTEQQANELVKVFTLALWGEDKQVVDSKCSVTKAKEQKFDDIFAYLREVAEQGDIKVQFELGRFYYNGVNRDYTEAVKWYRQAAEQGNAEAQYMLGNCYYNGHGVDEDYDEATKWYRKAAEQGNANAQYRLGDCYYYGSRGYEDRGAEGVKWWRQAAEQGNTKAQFMLGCYYGGCNVYDQIYPQDEDVPYFCPYTYIDYAEAAQWYRQAAEQGNTEAQCVLGRFYYMGYGVNKDYAEAVKWYRQAAEQGDTIAQFQLGNCYYNGHGVDEDCAEAVKWWRQAAEQEDTRAQYKLGDCYYLGFGVNEDPEEAIKWYEKAAEQGNSDAQCMLGFCYYYGSGAVAARVRSLADDYFKAVKWFREAAEQENAYAQCMLGGCYHNGDGVVYIDYTEAVKWYREAAEQGDVHAMCMLGFCYDEGNGVKEDSTEADKWYRQAAERGSGRAIDHLRHDKWGFELDVSQYSCDSNYVYLSRMNWANLSLFEKAAGQGNAAAQYMLGELHYFGNEAGKSYNDHIEESKLYYQAANQGHELAMYRLGCLFREVNDYANAAKWYHQAAEKGNISAIVDLADCYRRGCGVSEDYSKAKELYHKAEEYFFPSSYSWSFYSVANFYKSFCHDVDKDIKKAIKYYYLAARKGHAYAKYELGGMGLSDLWY